MFDNEYGRILPVYLYWYVIRYVWENLEVGYIQGMCDLLAPLLVVFNDGMRSTISS